MRNNIFIGALLCFIAAASWGAMFPIANDAFQYIDPFYFTIIRYVTVTIMLVIVLFWREGKEAFRFEGKGISLWFFGTMAFVVYNLFIFWGQDLLGEPGIMVASINEALMPMISILLLWVLYRNRPQPFTILCVIIGFVGVSLVITKGDFGAFLTATDDIIPSLLIFIAVTGWVVYTMGGGNFPGWSALRYSTLSCLLGTATASLIVLIMTLTGYVSIPTMETVTIISPHMSFMVIFAGFIALVGWNYGVSILSPLNGLLFINFVPVTTLVVSYFLGNSMTVFDYVGAAFIIIALLSNNIFLRTQQQEEEKEEEVGYTGEVRESIS